MSNINYISVAEGVCGFVSSSAASNSKYISIGATSLMASAHLYKGNYRFIINFSLKNK